MLVLEVVVSKDKRGHHCGRHKSAWEKVKISPESLGKGAKNTPLFVGVFGGCRNGKQTKMATRFWPPERKILQTLAWGWLRSEHTRRSTWPGWAYCELWLLHLAQTKEQHPEIQIHRNNTKWKAAINFGHKVADKKVGYGRTRNRSVFQNMYLV